MTSADDGPHPYYSEQLLDGLEERGVVSSFFVTDKRAELHSDIIERIINEGHLIRKPYIQSYPVDKE